MSLKVTVKGERELDREIDQVRKRVSLKGGEFADFAASAVRSAMVRNVQPFGMGKKAQERGKAAVKGDLLRCFLVVAEGKPGKRIIRSVGEARSWHRQRRNSRGRVRRGERREISSSIFRTYLEEVQKRVGMAKASLAGGAGGSSKLKGRVPGWLKPWLKTGDASRRRKLAGAKWTFTGEPKAVGSDRVMGQRGARRVLRKQKVIVLAALKREMRKELRKANRKVNSSAR